MSKKTVYEWECDLCLESRRFRETLPEHWAALHTYAKYEQHVCLHCLNRMTAWLDEHPVTAERIRRDQEIPFWPR